MNVLHRAGNLLPNRREIVAATVLATAALSACSGSDGESTSQNTPVTPETVVVYLPATTVEAVSQPTVSETTTDSMPQMPTTGLISPEDCYVSFVGTPYFSQGDIVEFVKPGSVTLEHPDGSQPDSDTVTLTGTFGTVIDLNNVAAKGKSDYTNWAHGAEISNGTEVVSWNDDASFTNTNPIPDGIGVAAQCIDGQVDVKNLSR